ncbi:MAG: hypothetical protein ABI758_01120 [Candidatus Woesebacteria bacterium]
MTELVQKILLEISENESTSSRQRSKLSMYIHYSLLYNAAEDDQNKDEYETGKIRNANALLQASRNLREALLLLDKADMKTTHVTEQR